MSDPSGETPAATCTCGSDCRCGCQQGRPCQCGGKRDGKRDEKAG
jgi:hypothetical protein